MSVNCSSQASQIRNLKLRRSPSEKGYLYQVEELLLPLISNIEVVSIYLLIQSIFPAAPFILQTI